MFDVIWLFSAPFFAALVFWFLPNFSSVMLKRTAFVLSLVPLFLLLAGGAAWIGKSVKYAWLPPLGIDFYLRVDTLSLLFLYLTAIVVPISILSLKSSALPAEKHPQTFYALILLLEGLLIGFFTARDLAVFTLFWESMLIPLYFIIAYWGGHERQPAALKFIIYMIAGSALMVAAVLGVYFAASSFNLDALANVSSALPYAGALFAIFVLAFAVKTPLFPFHAWLPDAYVEAPTPGTVLLSGILSKAGIYGILRIGFELFPAQMIAWGPYLLPLAIAGVFYGSFAAWMQNDFKRLIAYSSLAHVNFILAGLFVWNAAAHSGAVLQSINHGITITALFLVAGWLAERLQGTAFGQFGGLAKTLPMLCWLTLFFVLASVGLPGLNNFVGEFLILFGVFQAYPYAAAVLVLSVIFSVVYMLRFMQRLYFGPASVTPHPFSDIGARELLIALPLVALILWIGVYPAPLLRLIQNAQGVQIENTQQIEPSGELTK